MINVLVVEDSRVIRDYLVYVLGSDPELRISDAVCSGEEALASVEKHRPDVILMDIHLPGIDGFETTRRIMSSDPVPIVICTSTARFDQMHTAMQALEAGALTVIKKPGGFGDPNAEAETAAVIGSLKLMSEIKLVRRWHQSPAPASIAAAPAPGDSICHDVAMVAIGASTGGPPAVLEILSGLPPGFPVPVLVVQHITDGFTASLVDWLASVSRLPVHLAAEGDIPLPGHVYMAPDGHHMRVGPGGEIRTKRDEPVNGLRPSVGVLFRSVIERYGRRSAGVLLTGMGRDGADELKAMADSGGLTIAQDEESCVVFGMPGEAGRLGAARFVLPPGKIAELLASVVRRDRINGGTDVS